MRLDGEQAPFRTAADRKKLVGCVIMYLRKCDIDGSGRGYFFPRTNQVVAARGREIIFENGDSASSGDLSEVVICAGPAKQLRDETAKRADERAKGE